MPKIKVTPRNSSKTAGGGRKGKQKVTVAGSGRRRQADKDKGKGRKGGAGGLKKGVAGARKTGTDRVREERGRNGQSTINSFLEDGSGGKTRSSTAVSHTVQSHDQHTTHEVNPALGKATVEEQRPSRRSTSRGNPSNEQSFTRRGSDGSKGVLSLSSSDDGSEKQPQRKTLKRKRETSSEVDSSGVESVKSEQRRSRRKGSSPASELDAQQLPVEQTTGRGRKEGRRRRGKRGRGEGLSSESGEEEEGGERGRKRGKSGVKEVRVSETAVAKWKPVSLAARTLVSNAMMSALGHCLEEVRGSRRRTAETSIQHIMQRVEREIAAAPAPPAKRVKSCAELKHRVTEMKGKCIGLLDRNHEIAQRLEERKLFTEERRENAEQLQAAAETGSKARGHRSRHSPPPSSQLDSDDEEFTGHIRDLLSDHTPQLLPAHMVPHSAVQPAPDHSMQ